MITHDAQRIVPQLGSDGCVILPVEDCITGNRVQARLQPKEWRRLVAAVHSLHPKVAAADVRAGDLIDVGDGWITIHMVWSGGGVVSFDSDCGCFELPAEQEVTRL